MAIEFTEKLARIFFEIMKRNNQENEEILGDPSLSTPLRADGTINPQAQKNIHRALKNSADNALLMDVLSTISSRWMENAKNAMKDG